MNAWGNELSEIRSTIDIMMERTRGMLLTDQERERLKKEELQKKAKGYALKLMDPAAQDADAINSLNKETSEDRKALEDLVWKEIINRVSNESELSLFFERFENWPFASPRKGAIEQFLTIYKSRSKNKSKDKKVILEREKKKLADAGISGSAVVPKFSKSVEVTGMEELIQQFRKSLS